MSTPSLLNIPYLYKAGTLYSQIPESGAGDFTVTRATTPVGGQSTRINKDGLIELVADNVPRLDYPLGGAVNGCPALLVEPSAQNLVLQSQAFATTWAALIGGTGVNPAITTNAVISPDGTQNAETVVFNRGAGNAIADQSTLQQSITIPTTGAYIFSVYAKASTAGDVGKQIFLRIGGAGALTAITLTANWVRYSRAEVSVASGSQPVQIGNRGTATLDNSVSVDLWGAQAEAGSIATSYIPTTTQAIARAADVVSKTGVGSLIGQTEGTIYVEFEHTSNTAERRLIALSDGTATNRCFIWAQNNILYMQVRGSDKIIVNPIPTGYNKVAFAYEQNGASGNMYASLNGGAIVSGTSSDYFTADLNRVAIGNRESITAGLQWNNRIRAAALYPNRLTNAQLATLTAP